MTTTTKACDYCSGRGAVPEPFADDGLELVPCPRCGTAAGPVTLLVVTARGLETVDEYPSLAAALDDARGLWMEEPAGPQLLVAVDQDGDYLAALMRPSGDPECCITTMADGTVRRDRCRYLYTPCGTFLGAEVTPW